jgi:hypothetical protein
MYQSEDSQVHKISYLRHLEYKQFVRNNHKYCIRVGDCFIIRDYALVPVEVSSFNFNRLYEGITFCFNVKAFGKVINISTDQRDTDKRTAHQLNNFKSV